MQFKAVKANIEVTSTLLNDTTVNTFQVITSFISQTGSSVKLGFKITAGM